MLVKDLEGPKLDKWVALAEEFKVELLHCPPSGVICRFPGPGGAHYNFSTNWSQGGPIIEREKITIVSYPLMECLGNGWRATSYNMSKGWGPTPLIAAMRAYVASKYGESVDGNIS